MAAKNEATADPDPAPSESGDRPDTVPGPPGWEQTRIRRWLDRLERAEEAGTDPSEGLPEPSDREELLEDVLTAAFGPPWPAAVPDRVTDDPEALHAWARWRKRRAEREREVALIRLVQRYPRPIHEERWKHLRDEVQDELRRRGCGSDSPLPEDWEEEAAGLISARLEECALDDWQIEALVRAGAVKDLDPDQVRAALEAIYSAVVTSLADEDLRAATAEEIEEALRRALQEAFAGDLAGPGWKLRSNDDSSRRNVEARLRADRDLRPADPLTAEAERIARARIESQAETLTEKQAVIYLRVERDGWTPKEAAEELGISAAAARNRLKRARDELRTAG